MPTSPASSFWSPTIDLDGPTALANAQSFVQRNVDYVIEFQTDSNFGPTVMKVFNEDGVKVIAIDIPMPGATFFGANNPQSGYMGGSYLAQAAINKFGKDKVKQGYFVVGELPQSGAIPKMRTEGQVDGFLAESRAFDKAKCSASTPRTRSRNPSPRCRTFSAASPKACRS